MLAWLVKHRQKSEKGVVLSRFAGVDFLDVDSLLIPVHGFVGVGPTLLDWEDEGEARCPQGQTCDGSDTGYHGVAGLRWSTANHRFTVGGELRYSGVPDAVGEAGITRLFDEDDLGGTTVGVSLLWRVR